MHEEFIESYTMDAVAERNEVQDDIGHSPLQTKVSITLNIMIIYDCNC